MKYFDRNRNVLIVNDDYEYLDSGGCADIYRKDDNIFKVYYEETSKEYKISEEVFSDLNEINSNVMMKIYELYSKCHFSKKISYILGFSDFSVDGYLAKYYKSDATNILLKNKEYLLNSINEIEEFFEELTNYLILVDDFRFVNSICTESGIVIIDPDCYKKVYRTYGDSAYFHIDGEELLHMNIKDLKIHNKEALVSYIIDLFTLTAHDLGISDMCSTMDDLDNIKVNEKTIVTDELNKVLKDVKYPLKYLIKK